MNNVQVISQQSECYCLCLNLRPAQHSTYLSTYFCFLA